MFIATFNNLSVVSQCMKLSFIGGGKNYRAGFELTTLAVIGTDCTCSWKSNYHTIKMTIFIII